jgi:DNA-binding MarR family transcriptional regulator
MAQAKTLKRSPKKLAKTKSGYNPLLDGATLPMQEALTPHFGYCFTKSALKLRNLLSEEIEKFGLHLPHMGLMIILAKSGPLNQISLGDEMAIDKATMVKILDAMEGADVVRRKLDPRDRRVKLVELTSKGRRLIPKMHKTRETVENRFLAALTKAEANELRRLISKLTHAKI